tara:strand:+ start:5561 stop:5704 length:144 start_codon:yes stop_codon:yes gene_type:complete
MNTPTKKCKFQDQLKKYTKKDDNFDALAVGSIIVIAVAAVCVYLSFM